MRAASANFRRSSGVKHTKDLPYHSPRYHSGRYPLELSSLLELTPASNHDTALCSSKDWRDFGRSSWVGRARQISGDFQGELEGK